MNTSTVFTSPEAGAAVQQYYDTLLDHAAGNYERINVDTRFGGTFILATGAQDAPPLVLLHGSSMNSIMWAKDMQTFAARFRVYAPDMPGEPGRSAPVQLPFDTPDYADWLLDVLDALGIGQTALIGASLGGWLTAKFAASHPERVASLVLLCPAGIGPQNHAFKDIALALLSKGEAGIDELFVKINGDAPIPEIMLRYQKLIAAAFRSRMEPIPLFTDAELRAITAPSSLFFGEKDIMLDGPAAVQRFAHLIPAAHTRLLPGKGHSLTGLADEIMAFL